MSRATTATAATAARTTVRFCARTSLSAFTEPSVLEYPSGLTTRADYTGPADLVNREYGAPG
jgi:hypothetical protein